MRQKTGQYHENHWKNVEATFYALTIIAGNSCFTQFSTRFYGNRSFAASQLFLMFAQPVKFYTLYSHIIKSADI